PATAGLVALAVPIVTLIYEHGRFTHADTIATAAALMCYAPGLVGYSAVKLVSPAFYALGTSRVPVAASAASVAANIVLNLALIRGIGHAGLALGTAMAALFNAAILLWLLRTRLSGIDGGRLLTALSKITVASIVMAAAAYEAERVLHIPFEGARLWVQAVRVFGAIGVGLAVLAAAAQLLRIREFTDSVRVITDRLKQRSEEHTSELQSLAYLVCRLLLEKKKPAHLTRRQRAFARRRPGRSARGPASCSARRCTRRARPMTRAPPGSKRCSGSPRARPRHR